MRRMWLLSLLVVAPLAAQKLTLAPEPRPIVPPGETCPEPPMQHAPWRAPDGVPADLATTTAAMFELGLPDPRGCEYRLVDIGHPCRGWVLPGGPGPRWVIDWQGQPHPARSAGTPGDLQDDCDSASDANVLKLWWRWLHTRDLGGMRPHVQSSPLAACLLLRAGATAAAVRMWRECAPDERSQPMDWQLPRDRFLAAVTIWAGDIYCDAQANHMDGRHAEALADLRRVRDIIASAETIARRLGLKPRPARPVLGVPETYLPYFAGLPALLADQQRRLARPARPRPLELGRGAYPTPETYVAALIDDLDQVPTGAPSLSHSPYYTNDPTLAALVAEGGAAIRPLAAAAAQDQRFSLCRAGTYMEYNEEGPCPVAELAHVALEQIAGERLISVPDHGGWRWDPVGQATGFAAKYGGLTDAERWYRQLVDSDEVNVWVHSAERLTRRDATGRLAGEALRGKVTPSPGELLATRLRQVVTDRKYRDVQYDDRAARLANAMVAWGGPRQLSDLAWLQTTTFWGQPAADSAMARRLQFWALRQRCRLGDSEARRGYAECLATGQAMDRFTTDLFEPLLASPGAPEFAGLPRRLFLDPGSPWYPTKGAPPGLLLASQGVAWAELLRLPEFREAMLLALADTRQIGQWNCSAVGQASVRLGNAQWTEWRRPGPNSHADQPAASQPVRICDAFANQLATVLGLPECWLNRPEAQRDEAVRISAETLRRYGERLGPSPDPRWRAAILLPRLNHAATPADVAAGRAVFAVGREQAVRAVALPAWPTRARWPRSANEPGDGLLWQAEERLEGGHWRRYYGYVGTRGPAMVPAEQIELPADDGQRWTSLPEGLDARLAGPTADRPTSVSLWLRNRRAVAVQVPQTWLRPTAEGAAALRWGIALQLACYGRPARSGSTEVSVPPAAGFPDDGRLRDLAPGESFVAGRLDLLRLCAPVAPGRYAISLRLPRPDGAAQDEWVSAMVNVPPARPELRGD